jgi:prepilin-type N-terminal cleavage/methylation domain-containing protein
VPEPVLPTTSFLASNVQGLTLIEVLMTLVLLSILTFTSIELVSDSLDEARYEQTIQKMERIKAAILGDPLVRENGTRTSFGYLGDVGMLPNVTQGIEALVARPTDGLDEVPDFAMAEFARFGAGWSGPYLFSAAGSVDTLLDAWGNTILYDPTLTPPEMRSLGADGLDDGGGGDLTGYNKDIVIQLPEELWQGTVYGYINNRGSPYLGEAYVTLYRPNPDWTIPSPVVSPEEIVLPDYTLITPSPGDPVGQFSFTGVPFGKRSIMILIPMPSPTPTMTIGPVIFTLDKKNLELNEDSFDISNQ